MRQMLRTRMGLWLQPMCCGHVGLLLRFLIKLTEMNSEGLSEEHKMREKTKMIFKLDFDEIQETRLYTEIRCESDWSHI